MKWFTLVGSKIGTLTGCLFTWVWPYKTLNCFVDGYSRSSRWRSCGKFVWAIPASVYDFCIVEHVSFLEKIFAGTFSTCTLSRRFPPTLHRSATASPCRKRDDPLCHTNLATDPASKGQVPFVFCILRSITGNNMLTMRSFQNRGNDLATLLDYGRTLYCYSRIIPDSQSTTHSQFITLNFAIERVAISQPCNRGFLSKHSPQLLLSSKKFWTHESSSVPFTCV